MKNFITVITVTVALLAASAVPAVEEHHPDQKPAAAPTVQPPAKDPEQAMKQLKENTDKLRAQVDKITKTKDPVERRKLVQEHMQTLRSSMMAASGMMGGTGAGPGGGMGMGMMGGGMMDCPMMGQMMGGGASGDAMMGRMQQMEKRMDMMQMMLEQMQKQQEPGQKR